MNLKDLERQRTMQLATVDSGRPWICTVYFVLYAGCFYWLSFPERRHSRELAANPGAAAAITIKQDVPVIGVQSEGSVEVVDSLEEIEKVLLLYVEKYGQGERFVELYKAGKNRHALYRLTPRKTVIFDEYNYPEKPRREITLS